MKNFAKMFLLTIVLLAGAAIPSSAQIENAITFTTNFPFYAQNTKMPAGSYRVTQTDMDVNTLLIESADHKHSAFLDIIPTQSEQTHQQSDVTFHKYGDVDYLNRLWIEGQTFGMRVEPTKAEKKAAAAAAPTEHTIKGKKG